MELPVRDPTAGLYRAAALFVEVYNERTYGTPRQETAKAIGRQPLRNEVLAQMKQVFITEGAASNLMNLVEIMLLKVYHHVSLEKIPERYSKEVTEAIRPPCTAIAHSAYRRYTEKKVIPSAKKGGKDEIKEIVHTQPPNVPISDKEIGKITSAQEKYLLRQLNSRLVEMRSAEFLESVASDKDLVAQQKKVQRVVENAYSLTDALKSEINTRAADIKANCVHIAKEAVRKKEAASIKEVFDATLWDRESRTYMESLPIERSIKSILVQLSLIDEDDTDINMSDVETYVTYGLSSS